MELEGHPTQDILEELRRRGALAYSGTDAGPDPEALAMARHRKQLRDGIWLYVPPGAYETGFDEAPRNG